MKKSNEPIFWSLFAAGGVVGALFIPALIVVTGFILPLELTGKEPFYYERIHGAVSIPIVRIILFAFIALPLFHFAHRFRSILCDIGLLRIRPVISVLCYGSAMLGTIIAAFVLWRF